MQGILHQTFCGYPVTEKKFELYIGLKLALDRMRI